MCTLLLPLQYLFEQADPQLVAATTCIYWSSSGNARKVVVQRDEPPAPVLTDGGSDSDVKSDVRVRFTCFCELARTCADACMVSHERHVATLLSSVHINFNGPCRHRFAPPREPDHPRTCRVCVDVASFVARGDLTRDKIPDDRFSAGNVQRGRCTSQTKIP